MANAFAGVALIAWAPIVFYLFRRFRPPTACIIAYLGAYLLLPCGWGFAVPVLPPLGRMQMVTVCVLIAIPTLAPRELRHLRLGRGLDWLVWLTLIAGVPTALLNSDAIMVGDTFIQGMTLWDGISNALRDLVWLGLPFVYGQLLFRRPADLYPVLLAFAVGGALYSVLVLFEVRMSPNLHFWVYGFTAWGEESFALNMRGGGWRPTVFVGSGLGLSLLVSHTMMAAVTVRRARLPMWRLPARWVGPYLYVVLLLCKSVGAILLGSLAALSQIYLRPRVQVRIAAVLCLLAVSYPLLRSWDKVPVDHLNDFAKAISNDRYLSLNFRFQEEKELLDRASERPWFGWGTYGRPSIYDAESGQNISIADGYWVISLGSYGIVGFLGRFLLFAVPVWACALRFKRLTSERERRVVIGVVWIVATQLVDCVPNSMLDSVHFLLCGALTGVVSRLGQHGPVRAARAKAAIPRVGEPAHGVGAAS